MSREIRPDPNVIHPVPGFDTVTYVKPTITNPNIIVGDFTYVSDKDFQSHVTHHYVGNPAKPTRKRFDEGLIALLLQLKWWEKSAEEINDLIPILTNSDLAFVRGELERLMVA